MNLLTVGVMHLVTEGYGYLAQNTVQGQLDKTTQRSEERRGFLLCALRSAALQIRLGHRGSQIIRVIFVCRNGGQARPLYRKRSQIEVLVTL